jgi:hypothetical protein
MMLRDLLTDDARFDPRFGALAIGGVAADSRAIRPGFLFAAVPGTKADGLTYVPQALAAGAAAVMAERAPAVLPPDHVAMVEVANVRACGRKIPSASARRHRGGHRHQRQDLGRSLYAPDLGGARAQGREHRYDRSRHAAHPTLPRKQEREGRGLRRTDHARSR